MRASLPSPKGNEASVLINGMSPGQAFDPIPQAPQEPMGSSASFRGIESKLLVRRSGCVDGLKCLVSLLFHIHTEQRRDDLI